MLDLAARRPSPRQGRIAVALVFVLVALVAVTLPVARIPLPPFAPFLPVYWTLAVGCDALTAFLLLVQYRAARLPSYALLAIAFVYAPAVVIAHAFAFPSPPATGGAFGAGPQTAIWLWAAWHAGFPLLIAAGVAIGVRRDGVPGELGPRRAIAGAVAVGLALAAVVAVSAYRLALPTLVVAGNFDAGFRTGIWETVLVVDVAALLTVLLSGRARTVVEMWLAVALVAALGDAVLTLTSGARYTLGWYLARTYSVITAGTVLTVFLAEIATLYDRLALAASIDGLTGIENRRGFDLRLTAALRNAGRTGRPVGLLMLDVDYFKRFNDAYGHLAGDEVLRSVAATIRAALARPIDTVSRYGGEEFAVVLPDTGISGAIVVANRIRAAVEAMRIPHPASGGRVVTVSVGATSVLGGDPMDALAAADAALYDAKARGRNRIAAAEPASPAPRLTREPGSADEGSNVETVS